LALSRSDLDLPIPIILFDYLKTEIMDNGQHTHIVKYSTFVWILLILLMFTFSSVAITELELGIYSVTAALVFATVKSVIVLMYFMHLKFEKKFYAIMMAGVILLLTSVIMVTFLDYLYR